MSDNDTDDSAAGVSGRADPLGCTRQVRETDSDRSPMWSGSDSDSTGAFPNSKAVNDALRQFLAEHPVSPGRPG